MSGKYTDAQKRAALKYMQEKTDDIRIRTHKGTKERWRSAAGQRGQSLTQFVIDAVESSIKAGKEQGE